MAPLLALSGCASESASRADLDSLKAELRATREAQGRIEQRLDRLETTNAVGHARSPANETPPPLTVIKLKPRTDPAPPIDTRVAVVEPAPEVVDEFRAAAPERAAPAPVAANPADFDQGLSALKTGNVEGGVSRLLTFAANNPADPKADNALYFAGLGQMGLEDYKSAALTFEKLLAEHPAGDAVQDGMLRLAECRVKMNQLQDAKALYGQVVLNYPGTAAANQAEQRLASLK